MCFWLEQKGTWAMLRVQQFVRAFICQGTGSGEAPVVSRSFRSFPKSVSAAFRTPKIASRQVSASLPRENVYWDISGTSLGHLWDFFWEVVWAGRRVQKRLRTYFCLGAGPPCLPNRTCLRFSPYLGRAASATPPASAEAEFQKESQT